MRPRILLSLLGICGVLFPARGDEGAPVLRHWTVEDFDAVIFVALEGYRDFANGKRTFSRASCVRCHRFAGEGPENAVAPDLAGVGENRNPRDLLESILDPGKTIAESHRVRHFGLKNGGTAEGIVIEGTGAVLRIVTDPRDPERITSVARSDIRSDRPSAVSAMPGGLLDAFEEEDVLDLLAYLLSGGRETDPLFRK